MKTMIFRKQRRGKKERNAALMVVILLIVLRLLGEGGNGCFQCLVPDLFAVSMCFIFPWKRVRIIPLVIIILSDWAFRRWLYPSADPYCIGLCFLAFMILKAFLHVKLSNVSYYVRNLNPMEEIRDNFSYIALAIWLMVMVLSLSRIPYQIPALCAFFLTIIHVLGSYSTHPLFPALRLEAEVLRALRPASEESEPVTDMELFEKVCNYMEKNRPFLVESFTIKDLAGAVITNKCYLSRTINGCSGHNFRYFVNTYRIRYATGLLMKNPSLHVSELWQLSGFGSESTFSSAFKMIMKETPSSWMRRIKKTAYRG